LQIFSILTYFVKSWVLFGYRTPTVGRPAAVGIYRFRYRTPLNLSQYCHVSLSKISSLIDYGSFQLRYVMFGVHLYNDEESAIYVFYCKTAECFIVLVKTGYNTLIRYGSKPLWRCYLGIKIKIRSNVKFIVYIINWILKYKCILQLFFDFGKISLTWYISYGEQKIVSGKKKYKLEYFKKKHILYHPVWYIDML